MAITPDLPGHEIRWTWDLVWILGLALSVRLMAYNGAFGSDDSTYIGAAIDVAQGTWAPSNYNGALRYGFNIPAGLLVWLFGPSPFVVNLWPLLCSLLEVTAVYAVAVSMINRRSGIFAAALLASAPLHIAVATRIHADPVVSMFVTISFTLLWFGWRTRSLALLFVCGLAMGGIFWTKELVAVTWLAFLPMLWLFRGRWRETLPVFAGVFLMLVLHGVIMTLLNGHPLHLVNTVLGAVKSNFIDQQLGEDAAGYYLRYLFFDLRHTGLLGFLGVVSVLVFSRRIAVPGALRTGAVFVLVWLLGLLLVLSVFPVSIAPLRFVMKQSNYISLFMGPLALLAGLGLATMPCRLAYAVASISVGFGVLLGFLQQADYRVFTANSKALAEWAIANPRDLFIGSTNNSRMKGLWFKQQDSASPHGTVMSFTDVHDKPAEFSATRDRSADLYAVLDRQTMNWVSGSTPVTEVLPCWHLVQRLKPTDLALGNQMARVLNQAALNLTAWKIPAANAAAAALGALAQPKPADIYRVNGLDPFCRAV